MTSRWNRHPPRRVGRKRPKTVDLDGLQWDPMTAVCCGGSRRLPGEGRCDGGELPSMKTQRPAELAWPWLRGGWADR